MSSTSTTRISASDIHKYKTPIPNREFIMNLLDENKGPLNREQLAKILSLSGSEEKEALRRRLRAMERDGQLTYDSRRGYSLIQSDELIEGRVIGHPEGFGFLTPDTGGEDLYLHNTQMLAVLDGDQVQARISGIDRRGRKEATILKVLAHKTTHLVGRLRSEDGEYFIQPENSRITNEIDLDKDHLLGAREGQYVFVEIIEYPCRRFNATGRVTELLGDSMAPGMEIAVAIRSHDIPHQWSQEVLKSANLLGQEVSDTDKLHRKDLRALPFVTIDGEDARDFDDAVYCKKRKNGGWRLFVAIADVSHYVVPGSPLDIEAQERATSVYFSNHVVPMLPEVLSNGLCSLNPNVDRLVMVCEMTLNSSGKMTAYQFYEGVIHSHARLTYNQVNALLTSPDSTLGKSTQQKHPAIVPHIQHLHKLFAVLSKARTKRGSIDFEKQEVQFKFTEDRKIDQILPVTRNDAHRMIEEFMLCANVATASFLEKLQIPALYRVHNGPQQEKLKNLRAFLGERGLTLSGGNDPAPTHYDRLLSSISGRNDAHTIRTMMLRSLSQAEYSSENQGHFGLAYSAYAHFTSPIRRYPDLLVHRAIRSIIRQSESGGTFRKILKRIPGITSDPVLRVKSAELLEPGKSYPYDLSAMIELAKHCSQASRRADKASWDVEAWLKCEYMQDYIGDIFTGTISSVTKFGLFIEIENIQVEGLIHISALKHDFFDFDDARQRLTGERTNASYGLGDTVEVRVVRVDLEQRKIEFELAVPSNSTKPQKKRTYKKARRK